MNPAVEAVNRVGWTALAREFDISTAAINKWRKKGVIPAERVIRVEELSGIPRHKLNPKVFPKPDTAA